ncbi:hypothetical protein LJC74_00775 [Eubacteriales bacterium OttesenSCG-928-A19]|nr:hypothetical protein [Eubacteriales bacterium OttesenSCG-928-A19]
MRTRLLAVLLLMMLLAMPGVAVAEATPMPTPEPWIMMEWGIPVFHRYTEGISLRGWMDDFTAYCGDYGIPLESDEFLHIHEFTEDSGIGDYVGRSFGVYRILAGGAELFLYSVNGDTAISFYVMLDQTGMRRHAMRDALIAYFPQVMRACIYATEGGGLDEAGLDRAMALYGDVQAVIRGDTPVRIESALALGRYGLDCHARGYENTGFGGHWQEEEPVYRRD